MAWAWPQNVWLQAAWSMGGSVCAALVAMFVLRVIVTRAVSRTQTDLDDKVLAAIERPVLWSLLAIGGWFSLGLLPIDPFFLYCLRGVVATGVVVSWTWAGANVVDLFLNAIVAQKGKTAVVNARTVPVFKMVGKGALVVFTAYFFFLAWDIDLTGWLASAGVIGVAVGFAAQDSLANLFAGVSIIADGPYKLGDFLVLDTGERGHVVEIGLRSTRIQTLDDTQIILPNSVMANARIINESAGPGIATRVSATVEVSYASDIDQVRTVLEQIGRNLAHVDRDPPPQVQFEAFGASGLVFQLRVWVSHPRHRARVLDAMNSAIYKRFAEEKIEIPYSKHDVYLHRMGEPPGPTD